MAMKELAESLTKEFSAAVQQQEQQDAAAITAISGRINGAYRTYSEGLEAVREKQIALGEQYRACLEEEGRLQNQFERELHEAHSQMAFFKHRKGDATPSPITRPSLYASIPRPVQEITRQGFGDQAPGH